METRVGDVTIHHVGHGSGRPVLVLHGGEVDHHETEACFEPAFAGTTGWSRTYVDLPGMGRSTAPKSLGSADDVVDTLLAFADIAAAGDRYLLIGHSAGAYLAQGIAARRPGRICGLALVCPLLPDARGVQSPDTSPELPTIGDQGFRDYFVVQTLGMLDRYERYVAPAAALLDRAAMERIGARWELRPSHDEAYPGPTLVVAGRWDSLVGFAAASTLADYYPRCTLAVLDDAGHALPHEQPELMAALVREWLLRVDRSLSGATSAG